MSTNLPALVARLTHFHEAWIVGSAADPENKTPRDYDILVPLSKWLAAAGLIPAGAVSNSFGGFKCVENGIEIDIWPGELSWIMQRPQSQYAWQPKTGIRLVKIEPAPSILPPSHPDNETLKLVEFDEWCRKEYPNIIWRDLRIAIWQYFHREFPREAAERVLIHYTKRMMEMRIEAEQGPAMKGTEYISGKKKATESALSDLGNLFNRRRPNGEHDKEYITP